MVDLRCDDPFQVVLYKTDQAVALAKTMEVAALDFKAALKKERKADKSAADLRLSQMRGGSFSHDNDQAEAVCSSTVEAVKSDSRNSSLEVSHVSVESLDTDEGTESDDDDVDGGVSGTSSDALSIDLDTLQAELDTTIGTG